MKNSITIIITVCTMFLPIMVSAQVDDVKMTKDLRVASKVLETLTQGDEYLMMYNDNVEGNYIEGYGVIFNIGGGYSIFMKQKGNYAYSYSYGGESRVVVAPREAAVKAEAKGKAKSKGEDENDVVEPLDFENIMVEFLVDYSQMINQLKPTDKIVVSTKKSDYMYVTTNTVNINEGDGHGVTAELLKKDHNDYMSGKIKRDQLIAKIKINKNNGSELRSKDLDLFGAMLKTLYEDSYTDTYFISWKPEYERIKGVGAIYNFKVYSSYEDNGLYNMPGIDKSGITGEVRNENVEKLYPVFVKSMKENIVQYGRTINSLSSDEVLILKITLTKCDDCTIPKKVQFSVKQSVLADYNTGKISQNDAVSKIKVSEQ